MNKTITTFKPNISIVMEVDNVTLAIAIFDKKMCLKIFLNKNCPKYKYEKIIEKLYEKYL